SIDLANAIVPGIGYIDVSIAIDGDAGMRARGKDESRGSSRAVRDISSTAAARVRADNAGSGIDFANARARKIRDKYIAGSVGCDAHGISNGRARSGTSIPIT